MKLFRKVIFWCHLIAGTGAGIVILVMSVTGVLLTYERQMTLWADTRNYHVAPPTTTTTRLPAKTLLARVSETESSLPTAITLRRPADAPAQVSFGRERTLFVNPYTGEILGEGSRGVKNFFRVVTDCHRWLAATGDSRIVGRAITGACNLAFLFIVASGFYLWMPRQRTWKHIRSVVWFRRGLSGKARNFNWHNVVGFWCAVPLFIVVLSAVVISYSWASNLVNFVVGDRPSAPRSVPNQTAPRRSESQVKEMEMTPATFDDLWLRAEQQAPEWQTITLQLMNATDAPVTFTIDTGSGGQPQHRSQLALDRSTGEVVSWEPFSSLTLERKVRSILRVTHTGEVGGVVGQTVAGLASAGGVMLVWTGLSLALRRLRAWRSRRATIS